MPGLAFGSASCPKTILSNLRFKVRLSKFCIVIALTIVTWAPFFTLLVGTAAQVSPAAVFRRR